MWNDTIVDGMNRYEICQKNGIPFKVTYKDFEDEESAIAWIKIFQASRRNVSIALRVAYAREGLETLERKARENQIAALKQNTVLVPSAKTEQSNASPLNVRKEIAKAVGVSERTVGNILYAGKHAPVPIKEALNRDEIKPKTAYRLTQEVQEYPAEQQTEVAQGLIDDFMEYGVVKCKPKDVEIDYSTPIRNAYITAIRKPAHLEMTPENIALFYEEICKYGNIQSFLTMMERAIKNIQELKYYFENPSHKGDYQS